MCSAPLYANETTIDANMMDDGIENESLDEGSAKPRDPGPSSSSKRGVRKYKKAPGAPKRFRSAFIFFSQHKHKEIQEALAKDGDSKKTTSVAKMVSEAWKNMDSEEREKWDKLASEDKDRFDTEKAKYKGPWTVPIGHRRSKDPSAPKRPASAFLAFSNARRASVKAENKAASNGEISRILSKMWKEAPASIKQKYTDDEAKAREQYKIRILEWRQSTASMKREATKSEAGEDRDTSGGEEEEEEEPLQRSMTMGPVGGASQGMPAIAGGTWVSGTPAGDPATLLDRQSVDTQTQQSRAGLEHDLQQRLAQQTIMMNQHSLGLNNLESYMHSLRSILGAAAFGDPGFTSPLLQQQQHHQQQQELSRTHMVSGLLEGRAGEGGSRLQNILAGISTIDNRSLPQEINSLQQRREDVLVNPSVLDSASVYGRQQMLLNHYLRGGDALAAGAMLSRDNARSGNLFNRLAEPGVFGRGGFLQHRNQAMESLLLERALRARYGDVAFQHAAVARGQQESEEEETNTPFGHNLR